VLLGEHRRTPGFGLVASQGLSAPLLGTLRILPAGVSLIRRVRRDGPVPEALPALARDLADPGPLQGLASAAAVPVWQGEDLVAVLLLVRKTLADPELPGPAALADLAAVVSPALARLCLEHDLRTSERRLDRIINNTPNVAIEIYGSDGRVRFWNHAAERLFGFTALEAIGSTLDQLILNEASARAFLEVLRVMDETGEPAAPSIWSCVSKRGETRQVYSTIFPIDLAPGEREFVCLDVDISDQIRTEEALRRSEGRLAAMIDLTLTGYVVVDERGHVLDANDEYVCMTGRSGRAEVIGHSVLEWTAPADQARNAEAVRQCLSRGRILGFEVDYLRPDGGTTSIEINASVLDSGTSKQILTLCRDISERRRADSERAAYQERLEERVEARTIDLRVAQDKLIAAERFAVLGQFAGSVAHEIRNPLAVIANTVYLLQRLGSVGADVLAQSTERIARRTAEISSIIESMMNLTRADEPLRVEVDLVDLVRLSIESDPAPEGITVVLDLPAPPLTAALDAQQLRIAIRNLAANAFQAMPAGGELHVALDVTGEAGARQARLRISDTGSGIAPENLARLFQPFFTTKSRGLGFGLYIVKLITEKHGGVIRAETREGRGTCITVLLPLDGRMDPS
jgi:two-component system sensor kinase FixL